MPTDIHIVASCTDRKRAAVPADLRLRTVRATDIATRARLWWDYLQAHPHQCIYAQDLYAGDHWKVVMELPALAAQAGLRPHLWVASAGYGLIPSNAAIRPYSATFARGQADSVASETPARGTAPSHRQWWSEIARQPGPVPGVPRTIRHLAEANPHAHFLLVASPTYVAALEEDLALAACTLHRPDHLLIVSTPSPPTKGALARHWVPSNAHLQAHLGGSRLSLHARVARDILQRARREAGFLDAPNVRGYYERLIGRSDPPKRYRRTPMTDEQVRQFIVQVLRTETRSCSATLRLLRDRDFACEQQRFKRIFTELQERT